MKILNLYAGRGGNRALWGGGHEVTAVELDAGIAAQYARDFPRDAVRVEDAHGFLLAHFREYDFIWSSPPCPTHSRLRRLHADGAVYPDMALWQEVLLLRHFFKGKWCVENVVPYYEPLVRPSARLGRHLFWTNFPVPERRFDDSARNGYACATAGESADMRRKAAEFGFDYNAGKGFDHRLAVRNMTDPRIARYVLDCAEPRAEELDFGGTA